MRQAAKLFLDRRIGRRRFLEQLAQAGVAPVAAGRLAASLAPSRPGAPPPSRVLRDATGGEIMAELLVEWSVPYVFGLGGSEEVGFLDALVDRLSLQYVHGLHEGSVLAMADGYARASGRTPIVNLHSVAGAGYALGPMVNASKDRIPLVVTVGRQATNLRGTNAFLESVNLHRLPADYAQWTWDVMAAETIPEVLRRAFVLARVPPGGPTFVTFSKDLWEVRVAEAEILPRERSEVDLDVRPDDEQVRRIADVLVGAELPVLVCGRELARFDASDELAAIAELLGAPVFQDIYIAHAPVVFPTTHPLFCGFFDDDPAFPDGYDVFWSLGGTMFSFGARPEGPIVPREVKVIHTGLDGEEIGRTYPVDVGAVATVTATARAVLEELRRRSLSATLVADRRRRVEDYHRRRRERLDRAAAAAWEKTPVSNERLVVEIDRRLDPDALVVTELVTSEPYVAAYLSFDRGRPRRRNLATSGGVLGWGVPAAIGAKIAQPDRQVVALVGDGAFQFGVQSLWTAARYEVPVGIVVWKNEQYQANRKFLHAYGGRAAATGKYIGCQLGAPSIDNVAIARGYGIDGERVREPAGLGPALDRCLAALAEGRAYLVEVDVERRFGGAESTWYDFFSVARRMPRRS